MERKRVNISVDPKTYEDLQQLKKSHGFKNVCEVVSAFVHILLDRMQSVEQRRFDLPPDDGNYIDGMFDELGHYEPTPNNTLPPKQHRTKQIK